MNITWNADYTKAMPVREALEQAYAALEPGSDVQHTIGCLLAQQGCEDFDPAVKDGTLTSLCEIIMFG
jgi:hypothetical protein